LKLSRIEKFKALDFDDLYIIYFMSLGLSSFEIADNYLDVDESVVRKRRTRIYRIFGHKYFTIGQNNRIILSNEGKLLAQIIEEFLRKIVA